MDLLYSLQTSLGDLVAGFVNQTAIKKDQRDAFLACIIFNISIILIIILMVCGLKRGG